MGSPGHQLPFDTGGRYHIRGILGKGAHGVVYRVFDERWNHEVALKTIRYVSPTDRQLLKAEYRNLRDLLHRNLVRLYDLHVDGEQCFFTMEVVEDAEPFTTGLRPAEDAQDLGPATVERICRSGAQLADALCMVHASGRCHRDIKPSNVLLTHADRVVLLDLGLASPVLRQADLDTTRGVLMGTPQYLAPEQILDSRPLPASDWYGVGLVLYETVTGSLPALSDSSPHLLVPRGTLPPASELVAGVPRALDQLLVALLDPDPAVRPEGPEVLKLLRDLGGEDPGPQTLHSSEQEREELFVARAFELETLEGAFAAQRKGRFAVVEIVGSSGMGKTSLARRFLRSLGGDDPPPPLILEGRCHPQEAVPYNAFDAVVDDLARYCLQLDDDALESLLPEEGLDALVRLFPELRRVPRLDSPLAAVGELGDLRSLRLLGFSALGSLISQIAAQRSIVVWVDDFQWADAESIELFGGLFDVASPPMLMLVVSRRPDAELEQQEQCDVLTRIRERGTSHRLDLEPLAPATAVELAKTITRRTGGEADALVHSIVEQAGGVPYLVAELAHFVAHGGIAADELAVSTTASELLNRRVEALPQAERELVELAALCRAPQPPEILLAAAQDADRSRVRDLCMLRLLRWVSTGETQSLEIYHDRLRNSVTSHLSETRQRERHQALVEAMEGSESADPQQMLTHALALGDRARCHRHAFAAARRAEEALAFDQAAEHYETSLEYRDDDAPVAALRVALAEALANTRRANDAAKAFESAHAAVESEAPEDRLRLSYLRRRAGEQYLKSGHFSEGLHLMESFLAESGVRLPRTGKGALFASFSRRARLYLRGFELRPGHHAPADTAVQSRLDELWSATTALSMMDPVRADGIGLLHFHEALRHRSHLHVARSLCYEASYAACIGRYGLRSKSLQLLEHYLEHYDDVGSDYERAFHLLGAGIAHFFHSRWDDAVRECDASARQFRASCRGAEYEAAVALVFSLQALGQSGRVRALVERIPEAIREADARGDLFAANNYRGGFHALGRVAAGLIDDVNRDLGLVVETWKRGFYQMHAYHRMFAGVASELYAGDAASAHARVESDWPELEAGLFLWMELPSVELRWTRARVALAMAGQSEAKARRRFLAVVDAAARIIGKANVAAAAPHRALLRAGAHAIEEAESSTLEPLLREALEGYAQADMAIHREVTRWALGRLLNDDEGQRHISEVQDWMQREGVPTMPPLVAAIAPGLEGL